MGKVSRRRSVHNSVLVCQLYFLCRFTENKGTILLLSVKLFLAILKIIKHATLLYLSFCYAPKRPSPFFLQLTALLPSSQTKYQTSVSLSLATPLHHLHTHPLLIQHLLISPLLNLLLNLKSSRFCLTVLTSNLILILSPLGFSRNAHLF